MQAAAVRFVAMELLPVVAGALVQDGRVLAARRVRPEGWEFPGGKVEPGETPQRALERELREELGIDVRCHRLLGAASDDVIELQLWLVEALAGLPAAGPDHRELRWVGRDELDGLDWLPVDRHLLEAVKTALQ